MTERRSQVDPVDDTPLDPIAESPEALAPDGPTRGRAGALVYLALVMGLISLLLWWTAQERRADPPPAVTGTAAATPAGSAPDLRTP